LRVARFGLTAYSLFLMPEIAIFVHRIRWCRPAAAVRRCKVQVSPCAQLELPYRRQRALRVVTMAT
jgi:hypothetical protein